MLEIQGMSPMADYFIIAHATSERQLQALVEAVKDVSAETGQPARVEGEAPSGWVLVDHGGVVTHLFSEEKRHFYDLEEVWRPARVVVRVQ